MNFGAITDQVNALARRAVAAGAKAGASEASRAVVAAGRVGKTRRLQEMEVLPVRGSMDGWEASFRSRAWYRIYQDLGTESGIEAAHFYRAGRRAGRRAMLEVIDGGL